MNKVLNLLAANIFFKQNATDHKVTSQYDLRFLTVMFKIHIFGTRACMTNPAHLKCIFQQSTFQFFHNGCT